MRDFERVFMKPVWQDILLFRGSHPCTRIDRAFHAILYLILNFKSGEIYLLAGIINFASCLRHRGDSWSVTKSIVPPLQLEIVDNGSPESWPQSSFCQAKAALMSQRLSATSLR